MNTLYTGKGDDGTTGLFYGGRVPKDDIRPAAYGDVDEAQAAIGLARAACERGGELDVLLTAVQRDLYVLMAELATLPGNRAKLVPGTSAVTPEMVSRVEEATDDVGGRFPFPTEFVVPGQNEPAARLDVARTVVRRAERATVGVAAADSHVIPYLNRLSSLLWTLARWAEAGDALAARHSEDP